MSSMFTENKLIMLSFYENNEYGVPLTGKAVDWQNSKGRPSRQEIENELAMTPIDQRGEKMVPDWIEHAKWWFHSVLGRA